MPTVPTGTLDTTGATEPRRLLDEDILALARQLDATIVIEPFSASDVQGLAGWTDVPQQTIHLSLDLTDDQLRCTAMHELVHLERGDVPLLDGKADHLRELDVEVESARRLIPLDRLRWALQQTEEPEQLKTLLRVDGRTLRARRWSLTMLEMAYLAAPSGIDAQVVAA